MTSTRRNALVFLGAGFASIGGAALASTSPEGGDVAKVEASWRWYITDDPERDEMLMRAYVLKMREAIALGKDSELKIVIRDGVIGFPEVTPASEILDYARVSKGEKLNIHPPGV
jgi:hypothetical protein